MNYHIPFHKYSTFTQTNLSKALHEVKAEPFSLLQGICGNVAYSPTGQRLKFQEVERMQDLLLDMFPAWDKFSGDMNYPIRGGYPKFNKTHNKWRGEQGELRHELLDFLIVMRSLILILSQIIHIP